MALVLFRMKEGVQKIAKRRVMIWGTLQGNDSGNRQVPKKKAVLTTDE